MVDCSGSVAVGSCGVSSCCGASVGVGVCPMVGGFSTIGVVGVATVDCIVGSSGVVVGNSVCGSGFGQAQKYFR